jgi:hypothetical protein
MAGLAFTTAKVHSQELLAVDFGGSDKPVESGFVGQSSTNFTHTTTAGDITVNITGIQGLFDYTPNTGTAYPALYRDFYFKNGGTMTLTLSGPGISASTDYNLTFWSLYGLQARDTTIAGASGTTGTSLGPIAYEINPTSLSQNAASGTFTSDGTGNLTFAVGGTGNRPALNGFTIAATGDPDPAPLQITSITSVGVDLWELELKGEASTDYEFYSDAALVFAPGALIENLVQGDPGDAGTVGGTNDSVLTTDSNGDGKVRVSLSGGKNFVRAQSVPPAS